MGRFDRGSGTRGTRMELQSLQQKTFVQQSWEAPILGHSIFVLTQKLKRLKGALKRWNIEVYGNIKAKVEEESRILEQMQEQFDQGNMSEVFTMQMLDQENKVEGLLEQEQRFWRQKSRSKWDNDYDRSTKFFHACPSQSQ
ncbi:hypothetical protein IFM89_006432 [Coptis chinensis]|uniref:Uncharacterized protein n=1 Tax=Coptis chinensis TaxID=261450 RepID=A0A835HW80_9MAGN|nr:hypothetical protein IFM89_006432 [Coptis chinensis]